MISKVSVVGKKPRGFAALSPERRKQIAASGGRAVPAEKRAFSNREKASAAGKKGGTRVDAKKRSFSRSSDLAIEAGKKGGKKSKRKRKAKK